MISHVPEWFAGVNPDVAVYEAYSDDPGTDWAFADFKADQSKRLKLLFCIDMLNEGVHVDGISGVILFRPTISPIIYKQQIGRALTAGDSKTPLILDVPLFFANLSDAYAVRGTNKSCPTEGRCYECSSSCCTRTWNQFCRTDCSCVGYEENKIFRVLFVSQ